MEERVLLPVFPLYYFPPLSWFVAAGRHKRLLLDQHELYQRQTYANRCYIRQPQGYLALSIPVDRREKHPPMCQKAVSYREDWRGDHLRAIRYAYRNSPYYQYYESELEAFFACQHPSIAYT